MARRGGRVQVPPVAATPTAAWGRCGGRLLELHTASLRVPGVCGTWAQVGERSACGSGGRARTRVQAPSQSRQFVPAPNPEWAVRDKQNPGDEGRGAELVWCFAAPAGERPTGCPRGGRSPETEVSRGLDGPGGKPAQASGTNGWEVGVDKRRRRAADERLPPDSGEPGGKRTRAEGGTET